MVLYKIMHLIVYQINSTRRWFTIKDWVGYRFTQYLHYTALKITYGDVINYIEICTIIILSRVRCNKLNNVYLIT